MKRANPLIYCSKCKTNRAMKKEIAGWRCLECNQEHRLLGDTNVVELTLADKK